MMKKDRKENIKVYNDLKERSFFVVSYSKDDNINKNETYKKWKNFIEINNDIENYINFLNHVRNIFYFN